MINLVLPELWEHMLGNQEQCGLSFFLFHIITRKWDNGLVVKGLVSQPNGFVFKTTA